MNDRDSIISWIHSLPADRDIVPVSLGGSRKRKRDQQQQKQCTSPPDSLNTADDDDDNDDENNEMTMASTPKKERRRFNRLNTGGYDDNDDDDDDVAAAAAAADFDIIPRPGAGGAGGAGGSIYLSESISMPSSSAPSGASSPKKQMLNLRLSDPAIEINPLRLDELPAVARELVIAMEEIGCNHDILPHALEPTIMEHVEARDLVPRRWRHSFKPPAEADTLPGRIPAFEEVERICRKASESQQHSYEEVAWNCRVHLRLLESILEDRDGHQCDDFNAMNCTTARPHRALKPIWSPAKMIDLCVYASTDQRADLSAKMTEFCRLTPTATVNHTDFVPIATRPLVLSIETKKPDVHWDAAQLQIGIWHASQWAFLRWAVADKLRRQRQRTEVDVEIPPPPTQEDQDEFKAKVLLILSDLGFIPAVIVQGHRWHLVLSTYEGESRKTKLWADRQFGTTQTCLETYSIIAGVRQLTAWARDVYMPWFQTNVLD
ncbi:hypothetical protein F5Y12DRAFT_359200 [Xylaria sp. FL1777]|nr:hypothetical protein F5Y12DRAFT_359200 [Xylaria sp. FL1777]